MNIWQRWLRQPQNIWVRRAVFQIHLWTGIGVGIYILAISVSGSVIVFRNELTRKFTPTPITVAVVGEPLPEEQLKEAAQRAHPGFLVTNVWTNEKPTQPTEVWLEHDGEKKQRNFDPYTGADLGNAVPFGLSTISWLIDLHDNLLGGDTGRFVNGIGAIFLIALCLTGAVIWWPGIKNWRRSLVLHRKVGWKRFNWDLHSAMGFWTFFLVFMWGISGVYLAIPNPFNAFVDYIQPLRDDNFDPRFLDTVLLWFGRLHFGRYYGMPMKITWVVLGLIPVVLFATGAIMWWNRVLRPKLARNTAEYRQPAPQIIPQLDEGDF